MNNNRGRIISAILSFFSVLLIVFLIVKFDNKRDEQKNNDVSRNHKPITATETPGINRNINNIKNDIDDDDIDDESKISENTEIIVETYYYGSDSTPVENHMKIPAEFISMDEDELEDYLEDYVENMPLEEYLEGLMSYEIISFSNDKIKLRKTYASEMNENDYFISDVDGEIVVFYSDKDTVYDYTGIRTESLKPDEQVKVKIGYYVKNEEELYGMLESYSS